MQPGLAVAISGLVLGADLQSRMCYGFGQKSTAVRAAG